MSTINVYYIRDKSVPRTLINQIELTINSMDGPIRLYPIKMSLKDQCLDFYQAPKSGSWHWEELFMNMESTRSRLHLNEDDFLCFFTSFPNQMNWFSASASCLPFCTEESIVNQTPNHFFLHVDSYDWIFHASDLIVTLQLFVAQILSSLLERGFVIQKDDTLHPLFDSQLFKTSAQSSIEFPQLETKSTESHSSEPRVDPTSSKKDLLYKHYKNAKDVYDHVCHQETRGCLFDFCGDKKDLRFMILTAHICGECLELCEQLPQSQRLMTQVIQLLEKNRVSALSTQNYIRRDVHKINELPFPVAITRHLYERMEDPHLRFFRLLDHFDNLIRYTVITESIWNNIEIPHLVRPSLGRWVNLLGRLGTELQSSPIQNSFQMIIDEGIIGYRNEYRGHGFIVENRHYRDILNGLEPIILEIETQLASLYSTKSLILCDSIDINKECLAYMFKGDLLQGSNSLFDRFSQPLRDINPLTDGIFNDHILLINHDRVVSLDPYIKKATCSQCQVKNFLIYDGENNNQNLYIDLQQGHRSTIL